MTKHKYNFLEVNFHITTTTIISMAIQYQILKYAKGEYLLDALTKNE